MFQSTVAYNDHFKMKYLNRLFSASPSIMNYMNVVDGIPLKLFNINRGLPFDFCAHLHVDIVLPVYLLGHFA